MATHVAPSDRARPEKIANAFDGRIWEAVERVRQQRAQLARRCTRQFAEVVALLDQAGDHQPSDELRGSALDEPDDHLPGRDPIALREEVGSQLRFPGER